MTEKYFFRWLYVWWLLVRGTVARDGWLVGWLVCAVLRWGKGNTVAYIITWECGCVFLLLGLLWCVKGNRLPSSTIPPSQVKGIMIIVFIYSEQRILYSTPSSNRLLIFCYSSHCLEESQAFNLPKIACLLHKSTSFSHHRIFDCIVFCWMLS